jgi:hypothetical protein
MARGKFRDQENFAMDSAIAPSEVMRAWPSCSPFLTAISLS